MENVIELHSIGWKYHGKACSGKSYSPAAFADGKLVQVDSYKLITEKCKREVTFLSEGLNGENIINSIGIYFRPNSLLPILITEKTEFSLLQHIEASQSQCLQTSESYELLSGICSGLKYLHDAKIVHLNLSTKSVLLTDKLIPKISNFEYAIFLHPPKDFTKFSEDELLLITSRDDLFSFHFLPPDYIEILQVCNHCEGAHVDESIDMYSFACVMLNMFTHWPSAPPPSEKKEFSPKECQNYWMSLIAQFDTEISSTAKTCLERSPDSRIKSKTLLKKLKRFITQLHMYVCSFNVLLYTWSRCTYMLHYYVATQIRTYLQYSKFPLV